MSLPAEPAPSPGAQAGPAPIIVARASEAWFASDLHLDDDRPDLTARFLAELDALPEAGAARDDGPALFLLGDLFEYWIGDDHPARVAETLARALVALGARGWRVFLMRGNRDFLIGDDYARRCAARLLDEPALIQVEGERIVLVHGDAECLDDAGYQQWRQLSHSPAWQAAFLARPTGERIAMARAARAASLAHRQARTDGAGPGGGATTGDQAMVVEGGGDLAPAAIAGLLDQHRASGLIHGHTHRPAWHRPDGVRWRWVLPDWEVAPARGHILTLAGARP